MTLSSDVEEYLKREPLFRERKKKDAGIANLLVKRYPILAHIARPTIIAMVQDYATMDRAWRQALHNNPELRGTDYDEKVALEENKLAQLGYNQGQRPLIG